MRNLTIRERSINHIGNDDQRLGSTLNRLIWTVSQLFIAEHSLVRHKASPFNALLKTDCTTVFLISNEPIVFSQNK